MADTNVSLGKRLSVSLLCTILFAPVTYVLQKVLGLLGWLDPLARWLAGKLSVNTSPEAVGWVLALFLGLGIYGFILWRVWGWGIRDRNHYHRDLTASTGPVASLGIDPVRAEIPIWKAVEHVRAVIGDNNEDDCYPESRRQLRQAAERGRITLSGRKELKPPKTGHASDIWTEIDKAYWQDHELNPLATGVMFADHDHTNPEPLVVDGYRQRYWSVTARKGEIEGVWPRSANVGFDTTFHHLVRHVAIESKWAGAFVPNDAPDYLIRLLNDPWDALKREVCGPLEEGTLRARGILWPRNAPKENTFSDIPRDFWKTAQFDIRHTLLSRKANGASGAPGTYVDIIVRSDEVDAVWADRTPEEMTEEPSPFVALAKALSADEVGHEATWAELAARDSDAGK